jgi:hypothetical protein
MTAAQLAPVSSSLLPHRAEPGHLPLQLAIGKKPSRSVN